MVKKNLLNKANELTGKQWLMLIYIGIGAWVLLVLFLVLTVFALLFHHFSETDSHASKQWAEDHKPAQQVPADPYQDVSGSYDGG